MCHYDVLFISAPVVYSTYSCCGTFSTQVTKVQGPCLHQTNITSTNPTMLVHFWWWLVGAKMNKRTPALEHRH